MKPFPKMRELFKKIKAREGQLICVLYQGLILSLGKWKFFQNKNEGVVYECCFKRSF